MSVSEWKIISIVFSLFGTCYLFLLLVTWLLFCLSNTHMHVFLTSPTHSDGRYIWVVLGHPCYLCFLPTMHLSTLAFILQQHSSLILQYSSTLNAHPLQLQQLWWQIQVVLGPPLLPVFSANNAYIYLNIHTATTLITHSVILIYSYGKYG